jgi:hypothetical protein
MKSRVLITVTACCGILVGACNNGATTNSDNGKGADSVKAAPMPPVSLAMVSASPEFPNASLAIASVKAEKVGADSAKVSFAFDVKNYELKMQTTDGAAKSCANSKDGQHIHFILDNKPYKALYEPKNDVTLPNDGKEHYLMAFLSRSYHESIKSKGAALVYHFKIDEKGNLKKLDDPKTPMLFYSRPKGDYIGADTANLLLDFYVWNCSLATDGYKVKAEISNAGNATRSLTTTLDKWEPRFIQNLGTGKCTVNIILLDKEGKQVDGPMTGTNREFNLLAQEVPKN